MPALGVPVELILVNLGGIWAKVGFKFCFSLIHSPLLILKSIFECGLWLLLGSLLFIPVFLAYLFGFSLIPSVILFVSTDPQKKPIELL